MMSSFLHPHSKETTHQQLDIEQNLNQQLVAYFEYTLPPIIEDLLDCWVAKLDLWPQLAEFALRHRQRVRQDPMDIGCYLDFIGELNNVAEPADLIIGGILQISPNHITELDYANTKEEYIKCERPHLHFLRHLLVFIFAIEEINRRLDLLPNITLGYNIYDSCRLEHKAVHSVLSILSGGEEAVPNYNCDEKNNVVAFIGHLASSPSLSIAEITRVYGYPQTPQSVCTPSCLHGYRKILHEGQQRCCYYCVPCPEGEISNETDMETCLKCSEDQWSNERRDTCIPRTIEFLSYEDSLGLSLVVIAVVFCLLTAVILGIFIKYKDTAIVKANNQNLSFILLLSLILSFLCPFLFIGRPTRMSCLLRQVAFGNIFTISVSSILVKTITVVLAFKATKPNTSMKRWLGRHFSTSLLIIFSSTEVFICVIWLSLSPPFPYQNSKVEIGKIILQCDEGSIIGFYISLGYMGFLAVLSFVVAFLARKLPDTFNEAQYITFSMLVFCSVWIAFIMAYLSTKGKYMVAVVVFTIEVSSAGLLVCIFFPKCYIILLRPELNVKGNLIVQIKRNII
ncbi:vomeronasal type-2 receptor 26-like [Leptodactylus fuscus]